MEAGLKLGMKTIGSLPNGSQVTGSTELILRITNECSGLFPDREIDALCEGLKSYDLIRAHGGLSILSRALFLRAFGEAVTRKSSQVVEALLFSAEHHPMMTNITALNILADLLWGKLINEDGIVILREGRPLLEKLSKAGENVGGGAAQRLLDGLDKFVESAIAL